MASAKTASLRDSRSHKIKEMTAGNGHGTTRCTYVMCVWRRMGKALGIRTAVCATLLENKGVDDARTPNTPHSQASVRPGYVRTQNESAVIAMEVPRPGTGIERRGRCPSRILISTWRWDDIRRCSYFMSPSPAPCMCYVSTSLPTTPVR